MESYFPGEHCVQQATILGQKGKIKTRVILYDLEFSCRNGTQAVLKLEKSAPASEEIHAGDWVRVTVDQRGNPRVEKISTPCRE